MRASAIFLLFLVVVLGNSCQKTDDATQADLELKMVDGYGPFHPGFSQLGNARKNEPSWDKVNSYVLAKGIPENWSNVETSLVWLNTHQFIYQNFLAGNLTKTHYDSLQKSWRWIPDTTKLSEKPIKCYVYTTRGFDTKSGKWAVLIDTNNNLDFSDETPVYPIPIDPKNPYAYGKPSVVQYEVYQHGNVVKTTIPMVVKTLGSDFFYNFPQHAETTLNRNGKEYQLAVVSGFTNPNFEHSNFVEISSISSGQRVNDDQLVPEGDDVVLGGIRYKNKGVDFYNNVLRLIPITDTDEEKEYSLQAGHPFRPFTAREFTTKRPIALADYTGKYVYIDFWGTWCQGCVEDMPVLKRLYQDVDKTRFEFIGIVADSPDKLGQFIKKKGIRWPQILSDTSNQLIDIYGVTGFPTSVLIDPNGMVIARNLRGEELADTLKELTNHSFIH